MLDQKLLKRLRAGNASKSDIKVVYQACNEASGDDPFHTDMAKRACEFGYYKWPVEIRQHVRGKRILDVGCGAGLDAIGFITFGAREYVGIDRNVKLNSDVVKNKNGSRSKGGLTQKASFGWTLKDISMAFPRISFFRGTFEELRAQKDFRQFDLVIMHTVTEHLMQIEEVFSGCAKLLVKGGGFIYLHDNFYSWNGHHMSPKRVEDIDESDPEQRKYLDWNHILFDPPEGHYFRRGLNKIRLDDLRTLTEKYFRIEEWRETRNDYGRLTDEILERLPEYTERELTTSKVFCVAYN